MKREEKLLRAIGDVQDYMIQEAMQKKKRVPGFRWAAVAACICLLLTVTVGAAKWGVEWWHGKDERYEKYTVEWKYPLTPVEVREEAVAEIEKWVQWGWGVDGMDEQGIRVRWPDSYYIGAYLNRTEKIETIAELEAYLGIDLITSAGIDESSEVVPDSIDVIGLTELISEAEKEYAESKHVSLGGIEVDLNLGYSDSNTKARMKIFIPLTPNFAGTFPAKDWWYNTIAGPTWSELENGQFEAEEHNISGKEVMVFREPVEDPNEASTAFAVYSDGGIGYYIYCIAEDWTGFDGHSVTHSHAGDRLMALLENLE